MLLVGIAFGQAMAYWHWPLYFPPVLFQILGIVVLILIVLEGPPDLRLTRDERLLVWRSFLAAAAILMVQAAVISALLHFSAEPGVQSCLANAGALAVLCSTVVIPGVAGLTAKQKESIGYESTFPDGLGVMVFSLALQDDFDQGVLPEGKI